MIVADQISKHFNGVQAVKNISFEVKEGETMVLLGTSGCGKTTTLKMLNRLIEATSGSIHINGKNIFEENPESLRRSMGYVSQNNGLFPHFTVSENIAVVPKLLKWRAPQIAEETDKLLSQLKLSPSEFRNKYPDELSGGQKQRVAVARALIADPPVLLMDEPFGALDPVTRAGVRKDFAQLPELKKKTIVLVTHDVQEALDLGDRVCLMDRGEIMQQGRAAELLFSPVNDFVRSFFNEQRFFLELKTISLREIWDALPNAKSASKHILSPEQNLWDALETLSMNSLDEATVQNRGEIKTINIVAIHAWYGRTRQHS